VKTLRFLLVPNVHPRFERVASKKRCYPLRMPTKVLSKPSTAALSERDAQEARACLLRVAAQEFANHGFAGARLETVAAEAGITRAMIYYYFGGREGLFTAVLEDAYRAIWLAEQAVDTNGLSPQEALRRLVEFRVDYYIRHPVLVALVSIENQHEASHLKALSSIPTWATPSLDRTSQVLSQGQASGVFRQDIDSVDLYQVIVSLGFFNVANRHTFGAIFGRNWADVEHVRAFVTDVVLRYVKV
jgi:AcrR family transcriptional regulator